MSSNTETPSGNQSPSSSFADAAFDLLKDPLRRCALAHLLEADGPVAVTTVAEQVAGDVANPAIPIDVETIRTALHHSHLPRMAAANVIEYDAEEAMVTPTSQAEAFESLLSAGLE